MFRLLALIIPALIIMVGFTVAFFIPGAIGYLLAIMLVGIGSILLWWVEKKTLNSLEKDTALNNALNINTGGPDE